MQAPTEVILLSPEVMMAIVIVLALVIFGL
jgi:hypothetical protein